MMLLKKILPLQVIEKINTIVSEHKNSSKKIEEHKKEIDELKDKVRLLEKHNKLIVADVVVLSQNLANLFSIVYEHNEILNEDVLKKNITYH